jgi:hypothetical protein
LKKLKNEKELVKKAIAAGVEYGESRGVVKFEPTDSAAEKIEYIYRPGLPANDAPPTGHLGIQAAAIMRVAAVSPH